MRVCTQDYLFPAVLECPKIFQLYEEFYFCTILVQNCDCQCFTNGCLHPIIMLLCISVSPNTDKKLFLLDRLLVWWLHYLLDELSSIFPTHPTSMWFCNTLNVFQFNSLTHAKHILDIQVLWRFCETDSAVLASLPAAHCQLAGCVEGWRREQNVWGLTNGSVLVYRQHRSGSFLHWDLIGGDTRGITDHTV